MAASPNPGSYRDHRPSRRDGEDLVFYEVFPRCHGARGTLDEIAADLDRLAGLGITHLWLMPIHPVGELGRKGRAGSPYAVRDHVGIDPDLGDERSLRRLVDGAHERGLRVVMDWVANHAARDHPARDTHPEWFLTNAAGEPHPPVPDWSDVITFDFSCDGMQRFMLDAMRYWVREFDIDGFRCDVAFMVPMTFWERARAELRAIRPDIFLLAESEGTRFHPIFDATYDWSLYRVFREVHHRRAPAQSLVTAVLDQAAVYPPGSRRLRFIENHDKPRAAALFGPAWARAALTFVFLSEGVPLLYAGQEVGLTEPAGLFDRTPIPFSTIDRATADCAATLSRLRHDRAALRTGAMRAVATSAPGAIAAFERIGDGESVIVLINFTPRPVDCRLIGLPGGRHPARDLLTGRGLAVSASTPLSIGPYAAAVLTPEPKS